MAINYHNQPAITNKRAAFNYFISDTVEAGIMLTGTEIKAVREGKANLTDAFCVIRDNEMWVKNMHISGYEYGSYNNHEPRRDRKLLLHRHQIKKMLAKAKEKGVTIVPTKCYFSERGLLKLEIGIARGKKLYDKRDSIKEAESKREVSRAMKRF